MKSLKSLTLLMLVLSVVLSIVFSTKTFAGYCNLLYWGKINMGFGHVALEVFEHDNQTTPSYYISYAMGNDYQSDLRRINAQPEKIKLPNLDASYFDKFETWFSSVEYSMTGSPSYGSTYNLTRNNCAHAVRSALVGFGYKVKLPNRWALTPKGVRKEAYRIKAAGR
ncbi:MAG: hypothetical protein HQK51_04195 [Oligoflexia bacterium]|nr:hypothetical protein [Oligoflexia bacterium]